MLTRTCTLLIALFFSVTLVAQQRLPAEIAPARARSLPVEADVQPRVDMDTIFPAIFTRPCADSLLFYGIQNFWGSVSGTNAFFDLEKAQLLRTGTDDPREITEAWGFFAFASAVKDGNILAKVYTVNPATGGPGELLGTSQPVKTSEVAIDTNAIVPTPFPFETPVAVPDSFYLSFDIFDLYSDNASDTVALFSTRDGCGFGDEAWELYFDGQTTELVWSTLEEDWGGLITSMFVGAVLQEGTPSSTVDPFSGLNGFRLLPAAPNPAREQINLGFALPATAAVHLEVFSLDGRQLRRIDLGRQPAGEQRYTLPTAGWTRGTYIYRMTAPQGQLISRFTLQ